MDIQPGNVLITGGAQRIGRALAEDLVQHGWGVAIHYRRSKEAAHAAVSTIEKRGGRAIAIAADLMNETASRSLLNVAENELGQITCLINNASCFERDSADSATRKSWDQHMEINLRAPLVLTQEFRSLLDTNSKGCVINILDERVWNLTPHFLSYTVSKSALWTLTQTLALALAPQIRVNAVGPGPTLPSPRQTTAQFAEQIGQMPLGRGTTPQEICDAVRFILAAPAMTGQMIALDGGQHLGWRHSGDDPVE